MAKVVDVECPRCGTKSALPVGIIDAFTKEPFRPSCPQCGLRLEWEN